MKLSSTVQRPRIRAGARSLMLGVSALMLFAGSASAATFAPTDGPGLQAAIISANGSPGPDTILVNNTETAGRVYFPTATMTITDDLTIKKGGRIGSNARAQISGQNVDPLASDLFQIDPGVTAKFDTLIIQLGSESGFGVFHNFGDVTISHTTLFQTAGTDLVNESGAVATVNNSTFTDNFTSGALQNAGAVTFNNSTVNRHFGGGLASTGVLNVNNTILAENTGGNCLGPVDSTTGSLSDDDSCTAFGVAINNTPAALGPLGNFGGPVLSVQPNAGSPVINAGDNAICPTIDTRYRARSDGQCDIGSFEVGAVTDTTAPTCSVTAVRLGPPKQQDVTAQDTGSGLGPDAISGVTITNGTVAFTPFATPSRAGLVLTATKTNQSQSTKWSFTATDVAGNTRLCT